MKRFSIFFILSILFFSSAKVYADDVAAFVFITDPQTVDTNTVSKDITVQAQNSAGVAQPVPETYDLSFTSSSATGSFLNSSGNPVSTTMSKNTANRTFYYKDSGSGDFTLTVSATGRTSQKTFTAIQHMYVGVPLPGNESSTSTATTTESTALSDGVAPNLSGHSSPVDISTSEAEPEFLVSAGRDRLVPVGNSVQFQASITKIKNLNSLNTTYIWSFGDGTVGNGKSVTHTYLFPGNYTVVVNAANTDKQAVSRLLIKVFDPAVSIARVNGGIELWNKSDNELNLEDWNLSSDVRSFIFPKDTIIRPGEKIIFADQTIGFVGNEFVLSNPIGTVYSSIVTPISAMVATSTEVRDITEKISELKQELSQMEVPTSTPVPVLKVAATAPVLKPERLATTSTQTAAAIEVFEAPARKGFVNTLFAWPIKGFDFVRHLFVEE